MGIYALDQDWTLVHEFDGNFVCARNIGVPAFGTDRGTVIAGPDWQEISVGAGRVWLTGQGAGFRVALHSGDRLETFAGTVNSLVSEGWSELNGLNITGCWYDSKNSRTVISGVFDDQPIFAVYKNGWTFNIVDLEAPAVSLADGYVLTHDAVYSTTDYSKFNLLHRFENFEAKTMVLV
uniref:Uncharacterized protein n=1 Tax=Pseudomonas phage HRDY3 TaxID=3236930 RepID=A0AB39CEC2_9VIRU